jgi:hypothetical protein
VACVDDVLLTDDHYGLYSWYVLSAGGLGAIDSIPSDVCCWTDLVSDRYEAGGADRKVLDLSGGWARRWTVTWRVAGTEVICPVRDMGSFPVAGCEPVRRFSWHTRQRHRPGLEFLVSTGRHHGFESIAEQRLLLVLDFAGGLVDVVSQPLRMRFATVAGGSAGHIPDFLALTRTGIWLIDVRPAGRIGEDDRIKFAASAEAALTCGWRYLVVSGWRPHVLVTVDSLSSQRRPVKDPLRVQGQLLQAVAGGPLPLAEVVAATSYPVVGRAHLLHMIWHRRLGVDLARPLTDRMLVRAAAAGAGQ